VESKEKVKHSVLIIGDNHARNSASLLQGNLNTDYEVSGIVKPGAHMNAITDTVGEIVRSLTSDDVIIILGGSNDISRNNIKDTLKNVYEFVNRNAESNIVLINAPQRHDLIPESCVNTEVMKFNRQIKKK
jgi:lysophospholipase L1-like esterase